MALSEWCYELLTYSKATVCFSEIRRLSRVSALSKVTKSNLDLSLVAWDCKAAAAAAAEAVGSATCNLGVKPNTGKKKR